MASSVPSTPRGNKKIPLRTPRRCRQVIKISKTPDTPRPTPAEQEKLCEDMHLLTAAVRVRPLMEHEKYCDKTCSIEQIDNSNLIIKIQSSTGMEKQYKFQCDYLFFFEDEQCKIYTSQKNVYEAIGLPMLDNVCIGYNACLFAYGQTGSGKSYSMMGPSVEIDDEDLIGIIPRFCNDLFRRISELSTDTLVELSYCEIYNERIYDLQITQRNNEKRTPLKVREHPEIGPHVVNLTVHKVNSYAELRSLLQSGNKQRAVGCTNCNEKSSRSHAIVTIVLNIGSRRSKINLVDLAGSERLGNINTNVSDDNEKAYREGVSINQSLLTLRKVITALSEPKRGGVQHIPYRESTLTWLLRESLGGNSITTILATISPASTYVEETLATLRYACQARCIVNRVQINENPNEKQIHDLKAEIKRLVLQQQDYEKNSHVIANLEEINHLKEKLSEREKLLEEAGKAREQQFFELKMKEKELLKEAEKRKEELELQLRTICEQSQGVIMTPYKSNFLKEMEATFAPDDISTMYELQALLRKTENWCFNHGFWIKFEIDTDNNIVAKDLQRNCRGICERKHLEERTKYDNQPAVFYQVIKWIISDPKKEGLAKNFILQKVVDMERSMKSIKLFLKDLSTEQADVAFKNLGNSLVAFETVIESVNFPSTQQAVTFEED